MIGSPGRKTQPHFLVQDGDGLGEFISTQGVRSGFHFYQSPLFRLADRKFSQLSQIPIFDDYLLNSTSSSLM